MIDDSAFHAMIRHLLLESRSLTSSLQSELCDAALWGDEISVLRFLRNAAKQAGREDLSDLATMLLADRPVVFEQAFQISRSESDASLQELCTKLSPLNAAQLADVCTSLRDTLAGYLPLSDDKVDVLLDMPHWRRRLGEEINVLTHTRGPLPLNEASGIIAGVHTGFTRDLQRVRVFVHPKHRAVADKGELNKVIRQALGDLL